MIKQVADPAGGSMTLSALIAAFPLATFAWPGLDVLNSNGRPLPTATVNLNVWTAGGVVSQ